MQNVKDVMKAELFLSDELAKFNTQFAYTVREQIIADDLAYAELFLGEYRKVSGDVSIILKKNGQFIISFYSGNISDWAQAAKVARAIQIMTGIAMKWEALHMAEEKS